MSYVSRDSRLWFNLAGIVAAYQPIRAPGPMLARYNLGLGGNNRYKATPGTAPTWNSISGWYFTGASSTLACGFTGGASQQESLIVSYAGASLGTPFGDINSIECRIAWWNGGPRLYKNGNQNSSTGSAVTKAIMCVAGRQGYLNGVADGMAIGAGTTTAQNIAFNPAPASSPFTGYVLAAAFYRRVLSPAEVLAISRQIAYCNVNPDWSAWGRQRQWFYASQSSVMHQSASGATSPSGALARKVLKSVGAL